MSQNNLTTLERIAFNYALLNDDTDSMAIGKYVLLAKNGFRELAIHVGMNIVSSELKINRENMSVILPDDYQKFLKVGLCINGHVLLLTYDPTICIEKHIPNYCGDKTDSTYLASIADKPGTSYILSAKYAEPIKFYYTSNMADINGEFVLVNAAEDVTVCSLTIPETTAVGVDHSITEVGPCTIDGNACNADCPPMTDEQRFINDCKCLKNDTIPEYYLDRYAYGSISYDNNQYVGRTSWLPAGYKDIGLFRIDTKNNVMYLDSMCYDADSIVLEYQSNGVSNEKTYITEDLVNPITAYIRYQMSMSPNSKIAIGAAKAEWEQQYNLYKKAKISIPLATLAQTIRKEVYLTNLRR